MITKLKYQKTLSGTGFMRNEEGIKIDVEYKIDVYQKFIDTRNGEIPGIKSLQIAIHFLIAHNEFSKIVGFANGCSGTLECEKGKVIIAFTERFDPVGFVSTGIVSAENDQNDLEWII